MAATGISSRGANMGTTRILTTMAFGAALLLPGLAHAAQAGGTAQASVIEPNIIINGDTLRFGQFFRPATGGNLTIRVDGTVATTGGMVAANTIAQTSGGRGPATFHLHGEPNRYILPFLPGSINISNGASTMTVNAFTDNISSFILRLDETGYYRLIVGATVNVSATQAIGTYTGTYEVTVIYL